MDAAYRAAAWLLHKVAGNCCWGILGCAQSSPAWAWLFKLTLPCQGGKSLLAVIHCPISPTQWEPALCSWVWTQSPGEPASSHRNVRANACASYFQLVPWLLTCCVEIVHRLAYGPQCNAETPSSKENLRTQKALLMGQHPPESFRGAMGTNGLQRRWALGQSKGKHRSEYCTVLERERAASL